MFRLNEDALWNEDPEQCCWKWATEADFIVPILTPKFLAAIHGKTQSTDNANVLPTSPKLNKLIYKVALTAYTSRGCKNFKIRPFIPLGLVRSLRNSVEVTMDPLFKHTWKQLTKARVQSRLKSLMDEAVRRKQRVQIRKTESN